jgi:hypothetical protein
LITITRYRARRLRAISRLRVLGITQRVAIPPLVLRAEGVQLRAQYRYHELAVEYVDPGNYSQESKGRRTCRFARPAS